jgi:DTW domain-containing protein YfiP
MRKRCPKCEFILERCLCSSLQSIPNKTTLIILQHPSEKNHALNTVQLMTKCFEKIYVLSGENFDHEKELLQIIESHKCALLFPGENASTLTKNESGFTHLILIDGSWKKAKKIFFSSEILHSLPRVCIKAEIKSEYKIRQSSMDNGLSTLEAAIQALTFIEPELDCESLKSAFAKMIDFQIEKMGSETFEKNYKKKGDE